MKPRPSLWNFSPFGSPSYSRPTETSPAGVIRKRRPHGMSVTHRLPSLSKEGPSRKVGVGWPGNYTSAQWVRSAPRPNFSGMVVKTLASTAGGAANIVRLLRLEHGLTRTGRAHIPFLGLRSYI